MYQYVIDMYKKYIPVDKQYGITIWGVSDNEKEHVNWIPNDAPNLWDANYARKHAYKGVADGLAGKDVSEDFTGDLEINDFIIIKEGESEGYSSCYHPGADRMNNNNYCNPLFLKLSFSSCSSVVSA